MRCYYEVLGVTRTVESSELKKAYYKLSLQWHPDKNATSEDTTSMFQQILEAYRVLSDPQERAWYDSHRAEILQSGGQKTQMGATSQYEEERVDVFQYFTRSCFSGFDDGTKGFYTVYRKVFDQIAQEEVRAASIAGDMSDSSSPDNNDDNPRKSAKSYPTFGCSDSAYPTVVSTFYQFWEMYQTRKNYTWVEKYDIRCAESRPERRAMETENRQMRNAARKKRSEEIRQLVSYVKRRDKRVAAERERVQLANEKARERSQSLAKQARQREATLLTEAWNEQLSSGGIASQWADDFEAELARIEAELDGTSVLSPRLENGDSHSDESLAEVDISEQLYCLACDKAFASIKAKANHESSKKHRKQAELLRQALLMEEEAADNHDIDVSSTSSVIDSDLDDETDNSIVQPDPVKSSHSDEPVKLTKRGKKAQRKRLKDAAKINESLGAYPTVETVESGEQSNGLTQMSATTMGNSELKLVTTEVNETKPASTVCDTCGKDCESRNQLFAHLKESGHAKLKTIAPPSKAGGKKKKKA